MYRSKLAVCTVWLNDVFGVEDQFYYDEGHTPIRYKCLGLYTNDKSTGSTVCMHGMCIVKMLSTTI